MKRLPIILIGTLLVVAACWGYLYGRFYYVPDVFGDNKASLEEIITLLPTVQKTEFLISNFENCISGKTVCSEGEKKIYQAMLHSHIFSITFRDDKKTWFSFDPDYYNRPIYLYYVPEGRSRDEMTRSQGHDYGIIRSHENGKWVITAPRGIFSE